MTNIQDLDQEALTALLAESSRQYYVQANSQLTDQEFDSGLRRLAQLEEQSGVIYPGSPTRVVGSDLTGKFRPVRHRTAMLSLPNLFTVEEIFKYFGANSTRLGNKPNTACPTLGLEPKLDGASLSLVYDGGQLVTAKTRGDGQTGEDVTNNARTIRGVPLAISYTSPLEVRGEVVMRKSVLKKLNEQRLADGEDPYANCRNTAAAGLKLKSPAECASRQLDFLAYWTDLAVYGQGSPCTSHSEKISQLGVLGFNTVKDLFTYLLFPRDSSDSRALTNQLSAIGEVLEEIRRNREAMDIDIDGVVLKVDDTRLWAEIGLASKYPKYAAAFKFPPEQVVTLLEDICIQIGRTGQVTPCAVLKPVVVGGVTVTSASLMNSDELERAGNPAIGDQVYVLRSGEVIPRLVGVHAKVGQKPWEMPDFCPVCGAALERRGVHYYDPNPECPERVKAYLKYATSKESLDWDGMGDVAIAKLYAAGCSTLADLIVIDLATVFKGQELKKLLAERERVKTCPLWRKLKALGAEDVGTTHCKTLAQRYAMLEDIIIDGELFQGDPAPSGLESLIGKVAANNFMERMHDLAPVIQQLAEYGFMFEREDRAGPQPLAGMTFCITGTLISMDRDSMIQKIEQLGGVVKSSCVKSTTHLVVGDTPGATKTAAATKYGIPQIDEAALYQLMGEQMPAAPVLEEDEYEV